MLLGPPQGAWYAAVMRFWPLLLLAGWPASAARAHVAPVLPSLCRFDPVTIAVPGGPVGTAVAATDADTLRIVYDPGVSGMSVCAAVPPEFGACGPAVPRAFTIAGTDGTLAFPAQFGAQLSANGDVTASAVPVTIALGGPPAAATFAFTTGLVAANGTVLEGAPLTQAGGLRLVGVAAATTLPAPLGGASLLMTVACQPTPFPDEDQFALVPDVHGLHGRIAADGATLRATIDLPSAAPALAGEPLLLAVHVAGQTVATAVASGGLQGARKMTGTSDDGRATVVLRRRSAKRFALSAKLKDVALAAQAPRQAVAVDVVLDAGALLARGGASFRASRDGRRVTH